MSIAQGVLHVRHQRREPVFGQELRMQQINGEGCNPAAILHRRINFGGQHLSCSCAAGGLGAGMGTMLSDTQGLWLRQIKNLPRGVRTRHCRREGRTTA